ncbi:MAG: NADH-quinone oxidoreductase subunit J family protein [Phycisphaerae bacterium]
MDYALLAATALGAIGLYLMMPRERAPIARLGVLLSVMALAGFFLYMVHIATTGLTTAGGALGTTTTGTPPVYFYLFAAIMIAGSVGVVCQPKPVYAALYFVLVTLAGAGIFVLLLAEFMAIVLIIIYAGAILVTYVFVIMLASQGSGEAPPIYDRHAAEPFASVLVSFVLLGTVLQVLLPTNGRTIAEASRHPDPLMAASLGVGPHGEDLSIPPTTLPAATAAPEPVTPSNVQVLGADLYSHYALSLELAGVLLTIALVGAVVIARKNQAIDILGTGQIPAE